MLAQLGVIGELRGVGAALDGMASLVRKCLEPAIVIRYLPRIGFVRPTQAANDTCDARRLPDLPNLTGA